MCTSSVAASPAMCTPSRCRVLIEKIIFIMPAFRPNDMTARGLAKPRHATLIRNAPLAHLLLAHPDGRDLGYRIYAIGEEHGDRRGRHAEGMARGDTALLE